MADSFSTADDLNFLPVIKKNALKKVENVISTNFHFSPSYVTVNLAETRSDINPCKRDYTREFSSILNKQGLYVIFETPENNSTVSDIFYVGKTGKRGGDYAVFYTTKGGSGRLPLHIKGSCKKSLFHKAHCKFAPKVKYADFVDQYSVLCIILDGNKIGSKFDELLTWWEFYLILALVPDMNRNSKSINLDKLRKIKRYWPSLYSHFCSSSAHLA